MRKNVLYLLGLIAASAILQSCIDKEYDLGDIDMTISTGADITLPTSSTGDIVLKNIMDLKEDGIVQFVSGGDGNSYFTVIQDGVANIDPVSIDPVSFTPELSPIDPITVNLRELAGANPARKKIKLSLNLPVVGEQQVEIPDDKINFHYDLYSDKAQYIIDANNEGSTTKISEDIIKIDRVFFKDNTKIILNMTVNGFFNWIPNATLSNLALTLPQDLSIAGCSIMGQEAISIEPGKITLTDNNGIQIPTNGSNITLELTLAGAKEGNNFIFNANEHKVSVNCVFGISGTFQITADNINETALNNYLNNNVSVEDLQTIYNDKSLKCIMPESVTFQGNAHFTAQGIVLQKFQGQLQHEVGSIEPIKLDNLPDFLNDDDVVLDLYNPILLFKVRQEIPAPVTTDLTLKSVTDAGNKTVIINNIVVPSNEYAYYYAADNAISDKEKAMLPAEFKNATRLPIASGKVADLIKTIPDHIDVEVAPARVDASQAPIDITAAYDIDVEYKMFAPLTMGSDFQLVYRDTERDWAEDIEDFEDINVGALELKAQAISNLPTDLTLTLIPIDRQGNEIKQLEVNKINVKASPDGKDKATDVTFIIKGATINGHTYTINDAFAGKNDVKRLDGITYEARLDHAISGSTMNEKAKIVLKNIQLTLKGGITYDGNDDD